MGNPLTFLLIPTKNPPVLKNDLRQELLLKRQNLEPEKVQESSQIIQDRIIKAPFWPKAGKIGLYSPIKNEVLTHTLFQVSLETGLQVYFPRVEKGINFYEVNGPEDLQKGSWGILEPLRHCEILTEEEDLDLIIVPGIAFTKECFRIGYGKRFYDDFLEARHDKTTTVALAYDFQILENFPVDSWDQPLNGIMTEKNLYTNNLKSNIA